MGLFSRVAINLEETIGYYTGEVITEAQLYEEGKFSASNYVMWVCTNHIIINEGPKANYTRYINHSSEPNAFLIVSTRWRDVDAPHIVGTTADVGEAFLGRYLLPFEVISVLLLAAVVGAVVIARRDSRSEREIGERRR